MPKHKISDALEFSGEWQVAGDKEPPQIVAGTLKWGERAVLDLHDALERVSGSFGLKVHGYDAIHGRTTDSKLVSVLEATRARWNISIGPAGFRQPERLTSSWVVIGGHVTPKTRYREVRAQIPALQIWLARSEVKQTIVDKTATTGPFVLYEVPGLPEEITELESGTKLAWGINRDFSGDLVSEISVKTNASVRVAPTEPQDFDWFLAELGKVTTLLSFLAGSPMAPVHLAAKTEDGEDVEVLVALREPQTSKFQHAHEFFLLRNQMDASIHEVFSSWLASYERVGTPSQLALGILNSDDLWLHIEFLSLMQALEGFHRATEPVGLYTTEEAYASVERTLCGAIPPSVGKDHRSALKSRIKYGNQISLRKRLDSLAKKLSPEIRVKIFGGSGDVPKSWVATRNYFTHWDEETRQDALESIDIHRASTRMRLWLRTLYLDFAGIPQSQIEEALDGANKESQYLIQLNAIGRRRPSGIEITPNAQLRDTEEPPGSNP